LAAQTEGRIVSVDTPSGVLAAAAAGMRAIGYSADSNEHALTAAGAQLTAAFRGADRTPGGLERGIVHDPGLVSYAGDVRARLAAVGGR